MRESGYYPAGAEFDPQAPWNEKMQREVEVEVDVTLTVTKTIKVIVYEDYDGEQVYDAVKEYIKNTTLTDQENQEYTIDDYEIEDFY